MHRLSATVSVLMVVALAWARPTHSPQVPDSVIDLRTEAGCALVEAKWRFTPAHPVDAAFRAAGPDMRPSGPPNSTHQITPRISELNGADLPWEEVPPETLEHRRGGGLFSFGWFTLSFTLPESIGDTPVSGSTLVFECVFDDYAEVWVNGRWPAVLGGSGATITGWNAPNRVVLTQDASPGQSFNLAVFVSNGPLSDPPSNYLWARSATLDLYTPARGAPTNQPLRVTRLDPAIDEIIDKDAVIETLAEGFVFGEGPVWVKELAGGSLLFSDPNQNVIHRWSPSDGVTIFRTKSGYTGADIGLYRQPGSNGLALDNMGRLTICEHGNRRVTRLEPNGAITTLAARFEGKRLNSPNDLVYRSDNTLYFTDPPFGLPKFHDDPRRESPHTGVYCLREGVLRLVSDQLTGPNGLAFSPDEKYLYVANWDTSRKVLMRYEVAADGSLSAGEVFFNMTNAPGEEALDGVKVNRAGDVFVSGPGGIWIISPSGTHLGTIETPNLPANFAWGGDGHDLYLTARSALYRLRVKAGGTIR